MKEKGAGLSCSPFSFQMVFSLSLPVQENDLFCVSVLHFNNALILIHEKT